MEEQKAQYVEIDQDNSGWLFYGTREDTTNLCIRNLQTAFAILIVGENGIFLIHDTNSFSLDPIIDDLKKLGNLKFSKIIYNAEYYPGKENCVTLNKKITEVTREIKKLIPKKHFSRKFAEPKLCATESHTISIGHDGEITKREIPTELLVIDPNRNKRKLINFLNDHFSDDIPTIPIQYNGTAFTEPTLLKTFSLMMGIALKQRTLPDEDTKEDARIALASLKYYRRLFFTPEENLQYETDEFLPYSTHTSWKKYPTSALTGKYIGHRVLFFTLNKDQEDTANNLAQILINKGFSAEIRKSKDKPSLIVDLDVKPTSSPPPVSKRAQ